MHPLRIQLGFDIDPLLMTLSHSTSSREEDTPCLQVGVEHVGGIVQSALTALDSGADFLVATIDMSPGIRTALGSLTPLVRNRLMLCCGDSSEELEEAKSLCPAQLCLTGSSSAQNGRVLEQWAQDANVELLASVMPSQGVACIEQLPDSVVGLVVDARHWAMGRADQREQQRSSIEALIDAADESDRFVYMTNMPSPADAEEAAAIPGVAAVGIGAGLLPSALQRGLYGSLKPLLDTLVAAQQASFAMSLEEHDHDHDHDCASGCGCTH